MIIMNNKQKTKKLKCAVASIGNLLLITFWLGFAGAFEKDNIDMLQFILATLLLSVISVSIIKICRRK